MGVKRRPKLLGDVRVTRDIIPYGCCRGGTDAVLKKYPKRKSVSLREIWDVLWEHEGRRGSRYQEADTIYSMEVVLTALLLSCGAPDPNIYNLGYVYYPEDLKLKNKFPACFDEPVVLSALVQRAKDFVKAQAQR